MAKHYVSIPDRALCGAAIPHRDAETRRELVAASVAEVTCLKCIQAIKRNRRDV